MKRERPADDLVKLFYMEQIIESNAEIVCRLAVRKLRITHFIAQLIVFNDGRLSILQTHHSDSFIGRGLPNDLGADNTVGKLYCTDECRVSNALEHIVNSKYI